MIPKIPEMLEELTALQTVKRSLDSAPFVEADIRDAIRWWLHRKTRAAKAAEKQRRTTEELEREAA